MSRAQLQQLRYVAVVIYQMNCNQLHVMYARTLIIKRDRKITYGREEIRMQSFVPSF